MPLSQEDFLALNEPVGNPGTVTPVREPAHFQQGTDGTWTKTDLQAYHSALNDHPDPGYLPQEVPYAALSEPMQDMIDSAHLRADSGFDRSYRQADGTHNYEQERMDGFVLEFERIYHENRGHVPMDYLLELPREDLRMVAGDPEILTDLYRSSYYSGQFGSMKSAIEAEQEERLGRFMREYQVGEDEAARIILRVDSAWQTIERAVNAVDTIEAAEAATGQTYDFEKGEAVGDGYKISPESFIQRGRDRVRNAQLKEWEDVLPRTPTGFSLGDFANGLVVGPARDDRIFGEMLALGGESSAFEVDRFGTERDRFTEDVFAAFGVFGEGIATGASVVGWAAELPVDTVGKVVFGESYFESEDRAAAEIGGWIERNLNEAKVIEHRNVLRRDAEAFLSLPEEDQILSASMFSLPDLWAEMPRANFEGYQELLRQAGGDEQAAFTMWADEMTFGEDNAEFFKKQAELHRNLHATTIQELDVGNYSFSDLLLDVVGIWGEEMESVATATTIGGQMFWNEVFSEGDSDPRGFKERWRDSGGTVSGALGVDGTLTGLGLDLLLPALVDPTTWIFGAKHGKFRAGARTQQQLIDAVNGPTSKASLEGIAQVTRGSSHPSRGFVTAMDSLTATDSAGAMLRGTKGWVDEIPGVHQWKSGEYKTVTAEVDLGLVTEHFTEGAATLDDIATARARIEDPKRAVMDDAYVPEFTYNPKSGELALTSGQAEAAAYATLKQKSIPVRVKVDDTFRISTEIVGFDDAQSAIIHKIADGDIEANAPAGSLERASGSDTRARATLFNDVRENMIPADPAVLRNMEVGEVVTKDGRAGTVYRSPRGGAGVVYFVLDDADNVVGAVSGTPGVVTRPGHGGLNMGLADNFRGTMEQIWDIAREQVNGDEFVLQVGRSGSISDDAVSFGQKYANKLREEHSVATVPSRFRRQLDTDNLENILDNTYVNPKAMFGDEIYGDVDFDIMRSVLRRHYERGGDALHGNRTLVSVKAGNVLAADMKNRTKVGRWLDRHLTGYNNMPVAYFNNANSQQVINQTIIRTHAALGDLVDADMWLGQVRDHFARMGDLEYTAAQLTAEVKLLNLRRQALEPAAKTLDNAVYPGHQGPFPPTTPFGIDTQPELITNRLRQGQAARTAQKALDDEIAELTARQNSVGREMNVHQPLDDILTEYEKDINRKYLATSPKILEELKRRDISLNPDGTVPSSFLQVHKGRTTIQRIAKKARDADDVIVVLEEELAAIRQLEATEGATGQTLTKMQVDRLEALIAKARETDSVSVGKFNDFAREVLRSTQSVKGHHWDLTPLEYIAAAEHGIPFLRKVQQRAATHAMRNIVEKINNAWMIDKVVTPKTAIKVSGDELVRMQNEGGMKFMGDWMADRLAVRARHQNWLRSRDNKLSRSVNARLAEMENYPVFWRQVENQMFETNGFGIDTIEFNPRRDPRNLRNLEYMEAATRTSNQMLNDTGFQKYMEGRAAFDDWFHTDTKAQYLRRVEIVDPTGQRPTRMLSTADEAWDVFDTYFNTYALRTVKPSRRAAARKSWKEAAEVQSKRDGVRGGTSTLPEWVLTGFGEVYGNKRQGLVGDWVGPVARTQDRWFSRPINARRGRLATMVRESEWDRLNNLYADMGISIVPEEAVMAKARQRWPEVSEEWLRGYSQQIHNDMLRTENIISEKYLHNLVESKVIGELENTLYNFHISNLAGQSLGRKATVPFGKPYWDMISYWSRDAASKPTLRPILGNIEVGGIGRGMTRATEYLPFNPRTVGKVSRIAATDFDLENMEDDPLLGGMWSTLFGEADLDIGGAMFLPTEEANIMMVAVPGVGLFPSGLLDLAFNQSGPDPLEDPEGWERHYNNWADWIPGLAQNRTQDMLGDFASTVLGGGLIEQSATLSKLLTAAATDHDPEISPLFGGSVEWRITVNKSIRAGLADPKFWEAITEMTSEGVPYEQALDYMINNLTSDLIKESTGVATSQEAREFGLEFLTPGKTTPNTVGDNLTKPWIDNLEAIGLNPEHFDLESEDGRRQAAWLIEEAFFRLDPVERDTLMLEHPELLSNTISSYQWTEKAIANPKIDTGLPYKYRLDDRGATHRVFDNEGLIEPISGDRLITLTIGNRFALEKRAMDNIWKEQADSVNPIIWEDHLEREWKDWIIGLYQKGEDTFFDGIYEDAYDMWTNWTGTKGAAQILFDNGWFEWEDLSQKDIDAGVEPEKKKPTLPDKVKAWTTTMPSNTDALPEKYTLLPFTGWVNDLVERQANTLGVKLAPGQGHTFADLFDSLQQHDAAMTTNNAYTNTLAEYDGYSLNRSAEARGAQKLLNQRKNEAPAETQATIREFQMRATKAVELQRSGDEGWIVEKRKADDLFKELLEDDYMNPAPLNQIYTGLYGRTLGPIDWTPKEPPPLVVDDRLNANATLIIPRGVKDGDTIHYSVSQQDTVTGGLFAVPPESFELRLLGINAPEFTAPGGAAAKRKLENAIDDAIDNRLPIYYVIDEERSRQTDSFNRQMAWLYIGGVPYIDDSTMTPRG